MWLFLSFFSYCLADQQPVGHGGGTKTTLYVKGIVQHPTSVKTPLLHARYVKISLPNEGWLHLAEVEVIGRLPGEACNRNLALGRPTRQSSTADSGKAGSWLAVDGFADGLYSNGSVSHTNLENSPWWEVDLGEICKVEEIRVFNRTDGVEDRLKDIKIFVSNQTEPQPRWWQKPNDQSSQAYLLPPPPFLLSSVPLRVLSWTVFLSGVVFMARSLWRQVGVRKLFLCHGLFILLAIVLAIILKINRKFDSLPIIASTGASIALSKYNYGLEGYKAFLDYTAGPLNYGLLNSAGDFTKAIRQCVKLEDPRLTAPPDPEGLKVMALYFRDKYGFMPGYSPAISDYYALAFLLFGYSWPATFCLYFFLLSFSALLFFYSFQNYPALLALLTISLGGYVCQVTYMFYLGLALQDTRTISCLAVLPAMHLMAFIVAGRQWKGAVVLSTLAQLALLLLIMRIRHSAVWFSLALALGGMMGIGQSGTWQLKISKMLIALLPLLTMIGLKFGEKTYLDHEYINGTVSTSYTWHGIFMSLSPSSYFREKYGADGSDASAFLLGEKYYRQNEPDKLEETYWLDKAGRQINRLNWRLHEEGCRQMVQKIILENKLEFLRLTFVTKAEMYIRFLLQNTWLTIVPLVLVVGGVLKFSHIPLGDWASREVLIIPLTLFFGSWFTPLIGKALSHAVADGLLIFWILSAQGIFQAIILAKRIRAF